MPSCLPQFTKVYGPVTLSCSRDKEEAAYFFNDLQNILGEGGFPVSMSYKRPYEYDETENANVLMRAEALNHLSAHPGSQIIISYPRPFPKRSSPRRPWPTIHSSFSVDKSWTVHSSRSFCTIAISRKQSLSTKLEILRFVEESLTCSPLPMNSPTE